MDGSDRYRQGCNISRSPRGLFDSLGGSLGGDLVFATIIAHIGAVRPSAGADAEMLLDG